MWRLASSLVQSILKAIQRNPELQRHMASHPSFWGWLAQRFNRSEPFGLRLTVGAALASAFLAFFAFRHQSHTASPTPAITSSGSGTRVGVVHTTGGGTIGA